MFHSVADANFIYTHHTTLKPPGATSPIADAARSEHPHDSAKYDQYYEKRYRIENNTSPAIVLKRTVINPTCAKVPNNPMMINMRMIKPNPPRPYLCRCGRAQGGTPCPRCPAL